MASSRDFGACLNFEIITHTDGWDIVHNIHSNFYLKGIAMGILHGDVDLVGTTGSITAYALVFKGLIQFVDPVPILLVYTAVGTFTTTNNLEAFNTYLSHMAVISIINKANFIDLNSTHCTWIRADSSTDIYLNSGTCFIPITISNHNLKGLGLAACVGLSFIAITTICIDTQCAMLAFNNCRITFGRYGKFLAINSETTFTVCPKFIL